MTDQLSAANPLTYARFRAKFEGTFCPHHLDTRLHCDGVEHYYPCVRNGCSYRQYHSKHTEHGERR